MAFVEMLMSFHGCSLKDVLTLCQLHNEIYTEFRKNGLFLQCIIEYKKIFSSAWSFGLHTLSCEKKLFIIHILQMSKHKIVG